MFVGTTKAATLLGISTQRVRKLLQEGRIQGAFRGPRAWSIPLYGGIPKVSRGTRGPEGTWWKRLRRADTFIHVNQQALQRNRKENDYDRVLSVKFGSKKSVLCHEIEILGPSRVVYRPDRAKPCGATVWIEADPGVRIETKKFSAKEFG